MNRVVLAVALLLAHSGTARADATTGVYLWCIQSGSGTDVTSCGCDAPPFSDMASAVAAAEAVPDLADGTRPDHSFCIMGGDPLTEDIVLDGADGNLGEAITLQFEPGVEPTYCPPASGPSGAGITLTGPPGDALAVTIVNLSVDGPSCAGSRDVVQVVDADATLQLASLVGLDGSLLTGSGSSVWRIDFSRVQGGTAPIAIGVGPALFVEGSEFSNHAVVGSLIDLTGGGGFHASSSAIFANVSEAAPLLRADDLFHLHHTVLSGNVVVGAPLVSSALEGDQRLVKLEKTVVSRNRLLASGATVSAAPAPAQAPVGAISGGDFCLPFGASSTPYLSRAVPTATGAPFDAPLFAVTGNDLFERRLVVMVSTFVVENEVGSGGALVASTGSNRFLDVALVHNTVAGLDAPLLREDGQSSTIRLSTARNLIDGPSSMALVGGVYHVETSLDSLDDSGAAFTAALAGIPGIPGPLLPLRSAPGTFLEDAVTGGWSDCEKVLANCPNQTDCDALEVNGVDLACSLDAAIRYVPDPTRADLSTTWPWKSTWFGGDRTAFAGATGISCGARDLIFDEVFQPLHQGDGDGFTTLVDCDNDRSDIQPSLPEYDGFSSIYCSEVVGDCYTCPEGSEEPPVEGDDDDSGGDDDDSALDDDDVGSDDDDSGSPVDDDDAGGSVVLPEACVGSGCGVAYHCSEGSVAFLPLLMVPAFRRRRVRRR